MRNLSTIHRKQRRPARSGVEAAAAAAAVSVLTIQSLWNLRSTSSTLEHSTLVRPPAPHSGALFLVSLARELSAIRMQLQEPLRPVSFSVVAQCPCSPNSIPVTYSGRSAQQSFDSPTMRREIRLDGSTRAKDPTMALGTSNSPPARSRTIDIQMTTMTVLECELLPFPRRPSKCLMSGRIQMQMDIDCK